MLSITMYLNIEVFILKPVYVVMCVQVLRVQSSSGRFVIDGLTQDSSLWTLQKILEDKTTIHPDRQKSMVHYASYLVDGICCTLRLRLPLVSWSTYGHKITDLLLLVAAKSEKRKA